MSSILGNKISSTWFICLMTSFLCLQCSSTSLQFSEPSDRPLAYYRAPAPYQESGKARLNSVIITSKPFAIGEQLNFTARSNSDISTTTESSWKRQHYVTTIPTTTYRPRSSLHLPHYSIDCTNGKSCSETININSTPTPTFKPYSPDVLEKFLSDYAKVNSIKPLSKNEAPITMIKLSSGSNKSFNDSTERDMIEIDPSIQPTNRLANLYLDDEDDPDKEPADGKSRPHWSLIQAQQHNHPYDDRDGWVTLEAIPWSSSKISKWHSSYTGHKRPESPSHIYTKPTNSWDNRPAAQDWNLEKPKPWDRPQYEKPNDWNYDKPIKPQFLITNRPIGDNWPQETTHRPVLNYDRPGGDYNYKPSHGQHQQWITSNHPDIITDDTPENWPAVSVNRPGGAGSFKPWPSSDYSQHHDQYDNDYKYDSNRRPPTPVVYHDGVRPQSHPDSGEGEWVLLSSTKGYSLPVRHHSYQRALTFSTKPVTSTRSVKLTVLPALNGTANTTTSHGGLLEVESTFQTVEEAQRDYALKMAKNETKGVEPLSDPLPGNSLPDNPVRLVARPIRQRDSGRAVLAAVGAGMLPATMALLVPMMLGRRKRSTIIPNARITTPVPELKSFNVTRIGLHGNIQNIKRYKLKKRYLKKRNGDKTTL